MIAFIFTVVATILTMVNDNQLPKYRKIGMLSERMTDRVQLIGSLVKPNEKIAIYEHNLYGSNKGETVHDGYGNYFHHDQSFYSLRGGLMLQQSYYCSDNVWNNVEEISELTGIYTYKDNLEPTTLNGFKEQLMRAKAHCVMIWDTTSFKNFNNAKALDWALEAENMAIWQVSALKTIFGVLVPVLFIVIGFALLLVVYYKVFLFMVFGKSQMIK